MNHPASAESPPLALREVLSKLALASSSALALYFGFQFIRTAGLLCQSAPEEIGAYHAIQGVGAVILSFQWILPMVSFLLAAVLSRPAILTRFGRAVALLNLFYIGAMVACFWMIQRTLSAANH